MKRLAEFVLTLALLGAWVGVSLSASQATRAEAATATYDAATAGTDAVVAKPNKG